MLRESPQIYLKSDVVGKIISYRIWKKICILIEYSLLSIDLCIRIFGTLLQQIESTI